MWIPQKMEVPWKDQGTHKLSALKVGRAVNQCCSLEFVLVTILFLRKCLDEVDMLSISYFNGAGGLSTEFMEMFIGEIGAECHLVIMVGFVRSIDGFPGYGAKSVIMAVVTFPDDSGASGQFMNMFLFFTVGLVIIHKESPFSLSIDKMEELLFILSER